MPFAYEKLPGLDRDRLVSAVEPVLQAHGLEGVELIWRTDHHGWQLYVTVEPPASDGRDTITLDECSTLSRDLSAALDVADVIESAYRLEVGSPGVERRLYRLEDYQRFAGRAARVKCHVPIEGQWLLRGTLRGLDEQRRVVMDTDAGSTTLDFEQIESARLVLEMSGPKSGSPRRSKAERSKLERR